MLAVLLHLCAFPRLLRVNFQEVPYTYNWVCSSTMFFYWAHIPHGSYTYKVSYRAKMLIVT